MERNKAMNVDYTDAAMTASGILLKIKGFLSFSFSCMTAYLLSLFIPVSVFIESLYMLVIIDLFVGSWRSKTDGNDFDMAKALLTMRKFILYPIAVMLAGHFERTYSNDIPVTQVVAGTAAIFEIRSVYGHISALTGVELWSALWEVIKDKFPKADKKGEPQKDTEG
jgi:hypothetical protein